MRFSHYEIPTLPYLEYTNYSNSTNTKLKLQIKLTGGLPISMLRINQKWSKVFLWAIQLKPKTFIKQEQAVRSFWKSWVYVTPTPRSNKNLVSPQWKCIHKTTINPKKIFQKQKPIHKCKISNWKHTHSRHVHQSWILCNHLICSSFSPRHLIPPLASIWHLPR